MKDRNKYVKLLSNFYNSFTSYKNTNLVNIKSNKHVNSKVIISEENFQQFVNVLKKQFFAVIEDIITNFELYFKVEYIEFKYSLIYIKTEFAELESYLNFDAGFTIRDNLYYKTLCLFKYIYSLLDAIVFLNYMLSQETNPILFSKKNNIINDYDENNIMKVWFENEKYNPYIAEIKQSVLWSGISSMQKHWQQYWTSFAQINYSSSLYTTKFNFYHLIYISLFLFLWYLEQFACKLIRSK